MRVGQRLPEARAAWRPLQVGAARTPVRGIFLWSRAAMWLAALFSFYWFQTSRNPDAGRWDSPLLHQLGSGTDVWARWDSVYFLRIAEHGYDHSSAAFGPLYPALVWLGGHILFGQYIVAGIIISLAATYGSFTLLYRLAETRLGADGARRAVLYLAVFPMTLFLSAVYSESVFLFCVLGAFALAERRRFAAAALVAGLAMLTRSAGVALLPSLALIAWRSPQRGRALPSLTLALAVAAVYPLVLWWKLGSPWAFIHAENHWNRHLSAAGPFGGIWQALTRWVPKGASLQHALAVNGEGLIALVVFIALTVVAWRRFGAVYGLFCALSLAIPLSIPSSRWPLLSLPRFGLVIFPFFLALGALGRRPGVHTAILTCSSIFLGVAVAQWALWQWVA